MNRFIEFYQYTVIDKIGRIPLYNGLAGNINITAFSILMKSMFILYYLQNVSKFWKKILLFIIMILAFFAIALTGSRGALLSIWITIFVFSLVNIYKYLKYKNYQSLKLSLNYIIPFGISSLITELIFNTLRVSYRTGEIFTRGSESRLEYWWAAIRGFIDNPILGVGTGNWKIFSISYSKDYINSYVVPYHAHNDFLQLLAELGIFAGILILVSVFLTVKPLIADSLKKNSIDGNLSIYLFLSFTVYFIDSLLNFPISRPINIYTFVILFSIVNLKYVKFKINDLKLKNIVLGLLVLISVSAIYVNTRAFKSSQQQLNLYLDFNNKNFDDPVDEIMKYEDILPNITVTTMSIKTLKAFYLQQSGDTIQAIKVLKEGLIRKENPFLGLEESALSDIYGDLRQYDSAYKYGKIAYGKIKNNLSHVGNYFRAIIAENKNFHEAKALFNDSKNFNHEALWSAYVTIAYKNPDSFDIKRTLEISKHQDEKTVSFVNNQIIKLPNYRSTRPSIETGFHSFLKKYVIHTHSVYANILTCSKSYEKIINKIFKNDNFISIKYFPPGTILTRNILHEYNNFYLLNKKYPEIIFLKNHGIIVHAESTEKAIEIHEHITKKISVYFNLSYFDFPEVNLKKRSYIKFESFNVFLLNFIKRKKIKNQ